MGLVNDEGKIIIKKIVKLNDQNRNPEYIFQNINNFINENDSIDVESIGIGVPGLCRDTTIEYTCNLPFDNVEVRDYIKTKIPLYLSNDASCAAIAEYHFIDNKMYSDYALITIGTGIGAGLIIHGELYTGSSGAAGEIGHMVIDKDGIECNCGRRGCFEKYASVLALLRETNLSNIREVFYLIETNENIARVFDKYLENMSEGIANIINMYDVEMLVIGGSIAAFEEKFLYKLKSKVIDKLFNRYTYDLNLKCAKLKNDAGIIGASILKTYIK